MKGMKSFGKYGSVGFELLASIAVGYYFGAYLDRKAGTRWIALVGFFVGCYAGFRALYKTAKNMERDIENDERLERGEDPWAPKVNADDDDDNDVGPHVPRAGDDTPSSPAPPPERPSLEGHPQAKTSSPPPPRDKRSGDAEN
jgi:F0F1-type ATP synthase assembly protein I